MWRVGVWTVAALICASLEPSLAGRSPHADLIEQYYTIGPDGARSPDGARYSNNLIEDALLDVPGLISKYGYPVEEHEVVTEDGYILGVQRIPHGRDNNNFYDPRKPVVFVMHGLLSSSADFVVLGPSKGLAYILAEAGYDVWLGNARGNHYSRRHLRLNPDDRNRGDFWHFSWEEIGTQDLPAMIDHALKVSGKSRLHYIGHSQGTTAFWVMGSMRPSYNNKIISMQALAPVAYLEYNSNHLFRLIAPFAHEIERMTNLFGRYELFPNHEIFTMAGETFCSDNSLTQPICKNVLFMIAGRSEDMLNATMLPLKLAHTPAGASMRQLAHYGQHINKDHFRRYDHGTRTNRRVYGSRNPPAYQLSQVTAPAFLHYADDDVFAHVNDVFKLRDQLGRTVGLFRVPHPTFSHLDFMWGIDAKTLVYDRVINLMKSMGDN